jgi:hypothetical protein
MMRVAEQAASHRSLPSAPLFRKLPCSQLPGSNFAPLTTPKDTSRQPNHLIATHTRYFGAREPVQTHEYSDDRSIPWPGASPQHRVSKTRIAKDGFLGYLVRAGTKLFPIWRRMSRAPLGWRFSGRALRRSPCAEPGRGCAWRAAGGREGDGYSLLRYRG